MLVTEREKNELNWNKNKILNKSIYLFLNFKLQYLHIYEELQTSILITCTINNISYFIAPFLGDKFKALYYRVGFQNKIHIK